MTEEEKAAKEKAEREQKRETEERKRASEEAFRLAQRGLSEAAAICASVRESLGNVPDAARRVALAITRIEEAELWIGSAVEHVERGRTPDARRRG